MRAILLAAMFSLLGSGAVANADAERGGVAKAPTERNATRTTSEAKPGKRASIGTRCVDGTLSQATGRGACSRHGGVMAGGAIPTGPEPSSIGPKKQKRSTTSQSRLGEPLARCRDGSISYSAHRGGTCSRHGGVREWLGA